MTKKQEKALKTALSKLSKCGGDCKNCEKCHAYTAGNDRALYMAFGCDLLPHDIFDSIASLPSQLHAEALESVKFELDIIGS